MNLIYNIKQLYRLLTDRYMVVKRFEWDEKNLADYYLNISGHQMSWSLFPEKGIHFNYWTSIMFVRKLNRQNNLSHIRYFKEPLSSVIIRNQLPE